MESQPVNPIRNQDLNISQDPYTLTQKFKDQTDEFQKNLSLFIHNPDYVNPGTLGEFAQNIKNLHTTCTQIEDSPTVPGNVKENASLINNILKGNFFVQE
jgi:1,2-phenylacetyl-CoA epoxidase catalytic subunit